MSLAHLLLGLGPLLGPSQSPTVPAEAGLEEEAGAFVVGRGGDLPRLYFPRDETLVYRARVNLGVLGASVGTVTQKGSVVPYQRSVLIPASAGGGDAGETATIKLHAGGSYAFYKMDSTIESRLLPHGWPRGTYRVISEGTEKRRRENFFGVKDGEFVSSFRSDTDAGAPRGTRIWTEPQVRSIPEDTVDMLSAVLFTRTMIREELDVLVFPMIDKDRLWEVTIDRGEESRLEVDAGVFDAVEVVLHPQPFPGEVITEEKRKKFSGLFGIKGSIHLWVEKNSGIPIRIAGALPIGPLTLGIKVDLASYAGTPASFRRVE